MSFIVKKGTVSHISEGTTSYASNGNQKTEHTWAFRVGSTAAQYRSANHCSIAEGDSITAVGKIKKGLFKISALRNETTGATDRRESPPWLTILLGISFITVGVLTLVFIIGIVPLVLGIVSLYYAYLSYEATALLNKS